MWWGKFFVCGYLSHLNWISFVVNIIIYKEKFTISFTRAKDNDAIYRYKYNDTDTLSHA